MITYDNSNRSMEMGCDTCGEFSNFYGSFQECIAESKEEGWMIFKNNLEWEHYCPECRQNHGAADVFPSDL